MPKRLRKKAKRVHIITIVMGAVLAIGVSILAHQYRKHQSEITYSRNVIESIHLFSLQLSELAIDEKAVLIGTPDAQLDSLRQHTTAIQKRAEQLLALTAKDALYRSNAREIHRLITKSARSLDIILDNNQEFSKVMAQFERRSADVANMINLARDIETKAREEIFLHEEKLRNAESILIIVFIGLIGMTFLLTLWGAKLYEGYAEVRESANLAMEEMNQELEKRVQLRTSELQEAVRELKRSNADLERFAYSASHDLQEPIRLISGYVSMLSRKYTGKLDETANQYIQYAINNAQRMQDLINDLLSFSSIHFEHGVFREISLSDVARLARTYLDVMIQEYQATIEIDELPSIVGDKHQIERVFRGLFSNAIKFRHPDRPLLVQVSSKIVNEELVISVKDNGIGFDQKHADSIFELFARLHPRGRFPGTGTGLAIARKVVELHDGRIWVASTPNTGSVFSFSLPIKGPDSQPWDSDVMDEIEGESGHWDGTSIPTSGNSGHRR